MKFRNPFRAVLVAAGLLLSKATRAATIAKAEQFDKFHEEEDARPIGYRRVRRSKSSTISQAKIRKNRRRAHAAGFRNAFA